MFAPPDTRPGSHLVELARAAGRAGRKEPPIGRRHGVGWHRWSSASRCRKQKRLLHALHSTSANVLPLQRSIWQPVLRIDRGRRHPLAIWVSIAKSASVSPLTATTCRHNGHSTVLPRRAGVAHSCASGRRWSRHVTTLHWAQVNGRKSRRPQPCTEQCAPTCRNSISNRGTGPERRAVNRMRP